MNLKVYFVSSGYDSCYYVRCMIPLQAGGWWGDISTLRGKKIEQGDMMKALHDADVVVFQRPMQPIHFELMKALKLHGKKIVFDNDDTYVKDSGIPKIMNHIPELENRVDELLVKIDSTLKDFASKADLVTVSTEFLAKEYQEINKNVVVLPNCVCPEDWDDPIENTTGKIRIGISGSVASSRDYEYAKEAIKELSKMENVQLVLFGLPPDTAEFAEQRNFFKEDVDWWKEIGAEWYGWCGVEDYKTQLNEKMLDICLIPRIDSYFNRCKSNLKYLEHSMFKIPCIVQGFDTNDSPYQKDIIHGLNGLVACHRADWLPMCMELINDEKKRKEIGQKAYDYVVENYNINKKITLWENAYSKLYEND